MEKYIYFQNSNQKKDYCTGKVYSDFIDYAFSVSDYFMLVYVNYYGKGYSKTMREFKKLLQPFMVKSRTNPSWPGTLGTYCPNTTYKIVFYRNDQKAKEVLKRVDYLSQWSCPAYPQDLAFFKGNECWFYSVGHEKIAGIINPVDKDIEFLETNGLAEGKDIRYSNQPYFVQYNEEIEEKRGSV